MTTNFFSIFSSVAAVIKAANAVVFSCYCDNANGATRFFQLHDATAIPSPGAVPKLSLLVPGGGLLIVGTDFFTLGGIQFVDGLVATVSTTRDTYTTATAGNHSFAVTWS